VSPEDIALQEQALIDRVQRSTQARCERAAEQSHRQSNEMLAQARTEARQRLRRAVREERSRGQQALIQAQAQADLEQRQHEQGQLQQLLKAMWQELPERLAARWQDPAQQRAWIETALEAAAPLLPGRPWTLELASVLDEPVRTALEARARQLGAVQVSWVQDGAMGPGVRIRSGGACVSATVAGLLARRADIEADFLAAYLAPTLAPDAGAAPTDATPAQAHRQPGGQPEPRP